MLLKWVTKWTDWMKNPCPSTTELQALINNRINNFNNSRGSHQPRQTRLKLYPCWGEDTIMCANTTVKMFSSAVAISLGTAAELNDNNRPCQSSAAVSFCLCFSTSFSLEVSRCFLVSQNEPRYTSLPLLLPAEVCPTQKRRGVCAWGVIWNLNMWQTHLAGNMSKYKTPHSLGFLWDKCLTCLPILGCEKEGDILGYRQMASIPSNASKAASCGRSGILSGFPPDAILSRF